MELSALAGNPRLKDQLSGRDRLSHAYILSGPRGSGRHTLARLLSAAMVCSAPPELRPCGRCSHCKKVYAGIHPDVRTETGSAPGKPIGVDQIRALRADAHIRPNEGERKVYLLENAEGMNASAQNAMLKLLEEGPAYAAFLLLAENPGGLLRTVRSRCEELSLAPVPPAECRRWLRDRFPEKGVEELERAALDCQGILGRAVEALTGAGDQIQERRARAKNLARVLERGDELAVFQASMVLDKVGKEELIPLLEALEEELAGRLAGHGDRRRLFRAAELVRTLRGAAQLNANPGQLSGWLCAGMFSS